MSDEPSRQARRPRAGLIGTGPWADRMHAPALAAHPALRFAGLWGRDAEKAGAFAARHGVHVFTSAEALFEDCDLVAFAVPPGVQAMLAPRAAAAGCDLMLEKPLATDAAEAELVAEAIRTAGVRALSFYTLMHLPPLTAALDTARAGGGLISARYLCTSGALLSGPYAASGWRQEETGALRDIGPHGLSVLERLLGPARDVTPLARGHARAELLVTHASGASSEISIDLASSVSVTEVQLRHRDGRTEELEVSGDSATAHAHALDALLGQTPDETAAEMHTACRYARLLDHAATTPPPRRTP